MLEETIADLTGSPVFVNGYRPGDYEQGYLDSYDAGYDDNIYDEDDEEEWGL